MDSKTPNWDSFITEYKQKLQDGGRVSNSTYRKEVTKNNREIASIEESKSYLPIITQDLLYSGKKCSTTNCSEYSTTALANILGVDRDKISGNVSEDAWYKKNKVLSNSGQVLWETKYNTNGIPLAPKEEWWKSLDLMAGDFVSLGNGERNEFKQPELGTEKNGLQQENYARHSGIIIGKDENGVPLVRHNYLGHVYDEPINKIAARQYYYPVSVFRSNDSNNYKNNIEAYTKKQEQVVQNVQNYKPFSLNVIDKIVDEKGEYKVNKEKVESDFIIPYNNIKLDLVRNYGLSGDELDNIMLDLIGVASQESNLGNSLDKPTLSKTKQTLTDITPNFINVPIKVVNSLVLKPILNKVDNINEKYKINNSIPDWKREIEIANLVNKGLPKEVAEDRVLRELGVSEDKTYISSKSYGAFKQKSPSETWKNTIGNNIEGLETLQRRNWGKEWNDTKENLIANAIGLYIDNLKKAKKVYPNEGKDFYNKVAVLAHNSPSKAYNKEYTDFFIKGVKNPNTEEFKSDYLSKVLSYSSQFKNNSNNIASNNIKLQEGGEIDYEQKVRNWYNKVVQPKKENLQDGGDISRQGYKNNSPYKDNPYLMIDSPTGKLTMDNVDNPLLVFSNKGEKKLLKPNSGIHQFLGSRFIEIPMQDGGDIYNVSKISPRKGVLKNPDGTVSTHRMAYTSADGKFYAYPTLFQEGRKWIEKDDKNNFEAFRYAQQKGEVYQFDTEEEAKKFASGSWKNKIKK